MKELLKGCMSKTFLYFEMVLRKVVYLVGALL